MKLYLDPGHGGSDPGAQGNGLREKDLTLDIALIIRWILENNYENIDVRMIRTSDVTKNLDQRTNEANAWALTFTCRSTSILSTDLPVDMKIISTAGFRIIQQPQDTVTSSTRK